jgi:hypothetical protein
MNSFFSIFYCKVGAHNIKIVQINKELPYVRNNYWKTKGMYGEFENLIYTPQF